MQQSSSSRPSGSAANLAAAADSLHPASVLPVSPAGLAAAGSDSGASASDLEAALRNCAKEPIHIPGSIQPHGALLAFEDPQKAPLWVSRNAAGLFPAGAAFGGRSLASLFEPERRAILLEACGKKEAGRLFSFTPPGLGSAAGGTGWSGGPLDVFLHHNGAHFLLELDDSRSRAPARPLEFHSFFREAAIRLREAASLAAMAEEACKTLRLLVPFARVMAYRFDAAYNGEVIAESRDPEADSFLGLHFPESDIPAQARDLYFRTRLRLIPDAGYEPVPLDRVAADPVPADSEGGAAGGGPDGGPLDLGLAFLRSVSPVHLRYLRNMKVSSSMSVAVVRENRLWGLLACHHPSPLYVPYDLRAACEFLGQLVSVEVSEREYREREIWRARLKPLRGAVMDDITRLSMRVRRRGDRPDPLELLAEDRRILDLVRATGFAARLPGRVYRLGGTPTEEAIERLCRGLGGEALVTQSLDSARADRDEKAGPEEDLTGEAGNAPETDPPCGALALPVQGQPGCYLLWFRPEVVRTVKWGGDPHKPPEGHGGDARLNPRTSFALWKETVRGRSLPFDDEEVEAARDFAESLTALLLTRSVEDLSRLNGVLAQKNEELDSFAQIVSHDLKEPLRGIQQTLMFLVEDHGPQIPEPARERLSRVQELAGRLETLNTQLLRFTRMTRADFLFDQVDLNDLVHDARERLHFTFLETGTEFRQPCRLPQVRGDQARLGEVFFNLLENALKYNDKKERWVEVSCREAEAPADPAAGAAPDGPRKEMIYTVRDNGIGMREDQYEQAFRLFKRLHVQNEFGGGTGMGLTLIKSIIERHGGRLWIESAPGIGTAFHFTLGMLP